jgi:hypothetical protein
MSSLVYGYDFAGDLFHGGTLDLHIYDYNEPNWDDLSITVPIHPKSASAPAQSIMTNATDNGPGLPPVKFEGSLNCGTILTSTQRPRTWTTPG